jgi:hypothetical protein
MLCQESPVIPSARAQTRYTCDARPSSSMAEQRTFNHVFSGYPKFHGSIEFKTEKSTVQADNLT